MFFISTADTDKKSSSKGESFLKGTFILTIAGFVVKVIGSLNWIFVSRILGGEGIGLFEMLQLLGKEKTLARLTSAAEKFCK